MTFRTCYKESRYFIDEDKVSVFLKQQIATCSSNVETNGGQAECETFRISRSCEDGQRNFDTVIGKTRHDTVIETSHGQMSLDEMKKQDNDEKSFVRDAFSNSEVSI